MELKLSTINKVAVFIQLLGTVCNSFIVTRASFGEADSFKVLTDKGKIQYSNVDFDIVGNKQCLNGRHTISSQSSILQCYNHAELQIKESCSDGVFILENQINIRFLGCNIANIETLSIWDYKQSHKIEYSVDTDQLLVKWGNLYFKNRTKWDGLLVKIHHSCQGIQKKRCSILKFTGERTHPLANTIKYILNGRTTPPTTPPTTLTTPLTILTINTTGINKRVSEQRKKDKPKTIIIVGIIIPVVVLISAIMLVCICRKRKRKTKKKDTLCSDDTLPDNLCKKQVNGDEAYYTEPGNSMPEYQEIELDDGYELKKNKSDYSTIKPYKVKTLEDRSGEKSEYYYSTPYAWLNRIFRRNQQNTTNTDNYYSTPISDEDQPDNLSEMYSQVKKT